MLTDELIELIETQKQLMIAVSTGGPRIDTVNDEYVQRRELIREGLMERGIRDPNPFADLWKWYGKWSSDISGWRPRREYITDLYQPLLDQLRLGLTALREAEPTGWERVDRGQEKIRSSIASARDEEDFQAVGLLSREVLISLGQAVYDAGRHSMYVDKEPSTTDAYRMLEAFINCELGGGPNETIRKHAKASLALANELTHRRTAAFRDAAMCAEATLSVMNIVAIVSGRRDPA